MMAIDRVFRLLLLAAILLATQAESRAQSVHVVRSDICGGGGGGSSSGGSNDDSCGSSRAGAESTSDTGLIVARDGEPSSSLSDEADVRAFLTSFYFATGGPTNWLAPCVDQTTSYGCWANASEPVCNWNKVTCYGSQVSQIQLGAFGLSGTLPATGWSALSSSLVSLVLRSNALRGPVPAELGLLTELLVLDLSSNELSGAIEWASASWGSMSELLLSHNQFTGELAAGLPSSMVSLVNFDVSFNAFTGALPAFVAELPNLRLFFAESNAFSGSIPSFCASSTQNATLVALNLGQNNFSGVIPSSLADECYALTTLFLFNNQLVSPLPPNWWPFAMTTLDISGNNFDEPCPVPIFLKIVSLDSLNIGSNAFTGDLGMNMTVIASFQSGLSILSTVNSPRLRAAVPLSSPYSAFFVDTSAVSLFSQTIACGQPIWINGPRTSFYAIDPGYFEFEHCSCTGNTYGVPPDLCLAIPEHAFLASTSTMAFSWPPGFYPVEYRTPSAASGPGFVWRLLTCPNELSSSACLPSERCEVSAARGLAANCSLCSTGYTDRLCSRCSPGYFLSGSKCVQCRLGRPAPFMLIGGLVAFLFTGMLTFMWHPLRPADKTYGAVFGVERLHGLRQVGRYLLLVWRECALLATEMVVFVAMVVLDLENVTEVLLVCAGLLVLTAYLLARRVMGVLEAKLEYAAMEKHESDPAAPLLQTPQTPPPSAADGRQPAQPAVVLPEPLHVQKLVTLLLVYLQCASAVLDAVAVDWNAIVRLETAFARAVNLQFSALGCAGLGLVSVYLLTIVILPISLLAIAFARGLRAWALNRVLARELAAAAHDGSASYRAEILRVDHSASLRVVRDRAIKATLLVCYVLLFPIASQSLAWFDCRADPAGAALSSRFWLASAPWYECYTDAHVVAMVIAATVIASLLVGTVAIGRIVRRAVRTRDSDSPAVFLFANFRPTLWWFEAAIVGHRLLVALVTAVLPDSPMLLPALSLVVLGSLSLHLWVLPFRSLALNGIQAASHVALGLSAVLASQIQWSMSTSSSAVDMLLLFLVAVNLTLVAAFVVMIVTPLVRAVRLVRATGRLVRNV